MVLRIARKELLENYVKRLEELAGCPMVLVSIGPRRDQTITIRTPF